MLPGDDNRSAQDVAEAAGEAWLDHASDEPLEADRLAFADQERLPWLESSDDDDGEYEGADTGRVLGFVLIGLAVLAALVGGIWWLTHRTADTELVADGSVIEAPAEPYKQAPNNPGGKTFDGTGDSSFAVSEGQTRPARLGQNGAAAPVTATTAPAATPAAASRPAAPAAAPAVDLSGYGVQVGAFSSQAQAESAWTRLSQQHSALSGLRHRVVEGRADIGTVYRLQAVSGGEGEANALCTRLKAGGLPCQVKR